MDIAVGGSLCEAGGDDGPSRAERREQQVQRILDAAKACFVRRGFQGASMHEICAEVGMSPGALYRYFPSKESIIEAIVEQDRSCDAALMELASEASSVVDGVVGAGMAHIRHISETGNAPLFTEIRAEAMRNDAIRATRMNCMAEVSDGFRQRLETAVERGEIDPCVPLDTLMLILMAVGEGLAINDLPAQGVADADIETALRTLTEAVLRPRADAAL